MREILFRGLHRRKGEKVRLDGTSVESKWVYGGYGQYNEERGIIYQTEPEIAKFPVYAETVGQYTGLTEWNGTKIFEGDIVEYFAEYSSIYSRIEKATVYWNNTIGAFYARNRLGTEYILSAFNKVKVTGNIHDNPELLGGEENEAD